MREILFRGKRIDTGEWVYGSYLPKSNTICTERTYPNSTEYIDLFVDYETVGQYINLNDMHGNKIFEGDIVLSIGGLPWLIDFERNSFVCKDSSMTTYFALWEQWDYDWNNKEDISPSDRFEVIGNIYENPELLKY